MGAGWTLLSLADRRAVVVLFVRRTDRRPTVSHPVAVALDLALVCVWALAQASTLSGSGDANDTDRNLKRRASQVKNMHRFEPELHGSGKKEKAVVRCFYRRAATIFHILRALSGLVRI